MTKIKKMERKLSHAAAQHIYVKNKTKTHKRMCLWVPRNRIEEFEKTKARLLKKWGKQGLG